MISAPSPSSVCCSLGVLLDVKLSVGFGRFQQEFVQLAYLLILEVRQVPFSQVGPEPDGPPCRLQDLRL